MAAGVAGDSLILSDKELSPESLQLLQFTGNFDAPTTLKDASEGHGHACLQSVETVHLQKQPHTLIATIQS